MNAADTPTRRDLVRADRVGHVTWLTLDRPERLNALDLDGWRGLRKGLDDAARDPGCRVVAVTGEGRAFCAGDDVAVFSAFADRDEALDFFVGGMLPALEAIVRHPKPVVAAVNGLAFGGGFEIVALCDLAVSASTATFGLPEGKIGAWATVFVGAAPALATLKQTKALALAMRTLSADEAREAGLVNEVVEPAALRARVEAVAQDMLAASPHALEATKRACNAWLASEGLARIRANLESLVRETLFTPDLLEGTLAFTEKRPPTFALHDDA